MHELRVEGPVRYPGGKNGWFRVYCTCDPERLWWGATEAQALKPAKEHKKAKEAAESLATEVSEPESLFQERVLQWLDGSYAYLERDDLAALLRDQPGDHVTLTYRELWSIVETVRINSKPR